MSRLRSVPPIHRQRYEIHEYCKWQNYTFELYEIDGKWFFAIVDNEPPNEAVHLGPPAGYDTRAAAINGAWQHMWPGRQVLAYAS